MERFTNEEETKFPGLFSHLLSSPHLPSLLSLSGIEIMPLTRKFFHTSDSAATLKMRSHNYHLSKVLGFMHFKMCP